MASFDPKHRERMENLIAIAASRQDLFDAAFLEEIFKVLRDHSPELFAILTGEIMKRGMKKPRNQTKKNKEENGEEANGENGEEPKKKRGRPKKSASESAMDESEEQDEKPPVTKKAKSKEPKDNGDHKVSPSDAPAAATAKSSKLTVEALIEQFEKMSGTDMSANPRFEAIAKGLAKDWTDSKDTEKRNEPALRLVCALWRYVKDNPSNWHKELEKTQYKPGWAKHDPNPPSA